MKTYAVIDTNVLVSSFLTSDDNSPTKAVVESVLEGIITPLFSFHLIYEYLNVLNRPFFKLPSERIDTLVQDIMSLGIHIEPSKTDVILPDANDIPIYEIILDTRDMDSYLVTGNMKHFPHVPYVISPRQMMDLLYYRERLHNDDIT